MGDRLEHLVAQERGEDGGPHGAAARADPALPAARCDEELRVARRAARATETRFEPATVKVARHHAVDEAAPVAVSRLEALLPLALDLLAMGLHKAVERGLLGPARPVLPGSGALCGQGQLPSAAWTDQLRMTWGGSWVKMWRCQAVVPSGMIPDDRSARVDGRADAARDGPGHGVQIWAMTSGCRS